MQLADEENKYLLTKMAVRFVETHHGVRHSVLNAYMYNACKILRKKGIQVRLPYYWGIHGVHVVWTEITDAVQVNGLHKEDEDFVALGDVKMISRRTVIFCGDRNWTDRIAIRNQLLRQNKESIIVEGGANGADTIAKEEAEKLGYTVKEYPADWNQYGPAGGPIRNQKMIKCEKPDMVIAFHNNLKASKGTLDMLTRARKAGIKAYLVSEGPPGFQERIEEFKG